MNLPNKLTMFRVILIIPFVILLLGDVHEWGWYQAIFGGILEYTKYIALLIFVIASLTDLFDGKIARKYHLVTNFGKFADPLADKLLVASALICFIELGRIQAWIVLVIIAREFIISGFRLVAVESGIVIAAGWWGKVKTAVTMVTIIVMIPNFGSTPVYVIEQILIYCSLILTVISLADYIIKNKQVFLGGTM